MAQVLGSFSRLLTSVNAMPADSFAVGADSVSTRRFWAVDKIILAYLAFSAALLAGWWDRVPGAAVFMALHFAAAALLVFQVNRPNPTTQVFRHWYPLLYVAACYRQMAFLIPAVRDTDADSALANLDFMLWGAHPTVFLERIQTPVFTEFLQFVYTLFIPAVLLIAFLLWRKRSYARFRYYAFLIALGFLVSYIGYLIVPARGPRFFLAHLQTTRLDGLWLFHGMQSTLDRLESAHYDCFPSGHTELTLLACWGSRLVSRRIFKFYLIYTPFLILATVYLRYHYTLDVFAGAVTAFVLILAAPPLYKKLSQEAHIGRR